MSDVGREPGTVAVRELGERFRIYHSRPKGVRERLMRWQRSVYEDFWALRDVSFELDPGDSLAIIGANGSGKSTLLKCLARILPPDEGDVAVTGSVASLLELGAGFHGDLSGRENIFLNASILGMRRQRVAQIFDDIVRFAGVEDFIDTPVRNYSSGMYVRLGFAIAVNVDPDVLLIDEILAVGDAAFQKKCYEKMHDFKRAGKTLIVVTHDLDAAVRLCDRAILLEQGTVVDDGPTGFVVDEYRRRVMAGDELAPPAEVAPGHWGTGAAHVIDAALIDARGEASDSVPPGARATFRALISVEEDIRDPTIEFTLRSDAGQVLAVTNTLWKGIEPGAFAGGTTIEVLLHTELRLLPGRYLLGVGIGNRDGTEWFDRFDEAVDFHVRGLARDKGIVDLGSEIELRMPDAGKRDVPQIHRG